MARPKIRLDHGGMRAMLSSEEVGAAVRAEAEQVAARARALAPVDTGDYRASIDVEVVTTDRKKARVIARDPKSSRVEARSRPLGRALGGA